MTSNAEREDFEKWVMDTYSHEYDNRITELRPDGFYKNELIRDLWEAVQALAQTSGVTDEMVERAAKALQRRFDPAPNLDDQLSGERWKRFIDEARTALDAAVFSPTPTKSASVPVERLEALFKHWEPIVVGAGGFFRDELAELIAEYK